MTDTRPAPLVGTAVVLDEAVGYVASDVGMTEEVKVAYVVGTTKLEVVLG